MGRREVFVQFTCVLMLTAVALVPSQAGVIGDCFGRDPTIVGTPGEDELNGTPRTDVIVGLGENDRIYGLGAKDFICGGKGHDWSYGGPGGDRAKGAEINVGAGGNDMLLAEDSMSAFGGSGNDRLVPQSPEDGDRTFLSGGPGDDYLEGGTHSDEFTPGLGRDKIVGGDHPIYGDLVIYRDARAGMSVDLITDIATGQGHDRLISVEEVFGSEFADRILGSDGGNVLHGYRGRDYLSGRGGEDYLSGNRGRDKIRGGSGEDYCEPEDDMRGCEYAGPL